MRDQRFAAWVALIIGAVESESLLRAAGRNNPSSLLLVLFSGWVLAPFALLAWANIVTVRRPVIETRVHIMTVLIVVISLTLYAGLIPMPAGSAHVFVFVATPPATIFLLLFVFGATWLVRANGNRPAKLE